MSTFASVPAMGNKKHPPNNLRELRDRAKLTQEAFAQAIGMSKSGYIKVERSERGLDTARITKVAQVLKVSPSDIIVAIDAAAEPDHSPKPPAAVASRGFNFKKVLGTLSAGIWKDVAVHGDELDEVVSAPPSTRYPWARQFAWRIDGDSMNEAEPKPINDGDYVIGLSYEDIQEAVTLKSGMNVVVRQTRDNGQTYEETCKELRLTDETAEFHPRSSNPNHKPIIVSRDLSADDGRKVEIRAIVQYVFDNHEAAF